MKRALVAAATAVAIGGGVYGFAATADLGSEALGAGGVDIPSCQSEPIKSAYSTGWDATANTYVVKTITVSNIKTGCNAHDLGVALTGIDGSELFEAMGDTGVTGSVDIPVTPAVVAEGVTGVQVVVSK